MGTITRSTKAGGSTNIADGQTAVAADVNADVNTVVTEINGELDDANIKTAELPGAKSLRFSEIAAQANPGANDIVLHAIEQSGTRLTTRDSAGTLTILGTGAQIIRKTANETVNNSTTLQDDDTLLAALAANETVYFVCSIAHVGNGTADIQWTFTVPASAAIRWNQIGGTGIDTVDAINPVVEITTSGTTQTAGAFTTERRITIIGTVRNSTTAGNLLLRWAQNTATAVDTKVLTDSFLMVWRA